MQTSMKTIVLFALFLSVAADDMLTRHATIAGGHQSIPRTSTDYLTHFCRDYERPFAVHACGADTSTGGNPGPRDPATPINVILSCREGDTLVCATTGHNITNMCCDAVIVPGFSSQCSLIVRVFNSGGATTTLVTAQIDAWEATNDDIIRFPHATNTPPTLPAPPNKDQVRNLLTSVASLGPVRVPFNNRRNNNTDLSFVFCGKATVPVMFGVGGTSLSAESEVFVCTKEMGDDCGFQQHHGTDSVVTVFHSVQSLPLEYGRQYFIRLFSYGHEDANADINVTVANTVVEIPSFVREDYLKNKLLK